MSAAARRCRALFVAAPASGQGKTTVTAALARRHVRQGARVRVFKAGPDFLDPLLLAAAAGSPVHNLDLWMVGEAQCRQLLAEAAREADLILVEGVMGLYDGTPSGADLARAFDLPVLAVIDASAMAQTFGALVHGLATWPGHPRIAGAFANRVGSHGHRQMLAESLPAGIPLLGALPRDPAPALPSRHLGLLPPDEIAGIEETLEALAQAIDAPPLEALPEIDFADAPVATPTTELAGVRIAVARDAAFAFCYPANLSLLTAMGASLAFFSPLEDRRLPPCDALYLPGGYPELHLARLSANLAMHDAIHAHHRAGRPIVAECGGMLYLLESLTDARGEVGALVGLLPGRAHLQRSLANLGLQTLALPGGELRGHSFHYSTTEMNLAPAGETRPARHHGRPEPVWHIGRLLAGYLHLYLPSNPALAAALFRP
ncbi:MAG: cobyrinate a,c-diamide synthase [Rhodocyclaceae bacterium]|nr:cobyrinate a,c-diamide synthase [Rhodocyclaceae bacterium]